MVKCLLQNPNTDVNAAHKKEGDILDGSTPLHLAVQTNQPEMLEELLAHQDIQVNKQTTDQGNSFWHHSPLLLACKLQYVNMMKLLLEHDDINVNLRAGSRLVFPLYFAAA